ncbi:acyltransferase family protein [Noviherbaspirillum pedocola]|uniref:Acyltransferase n=1 Tax=Noviherbaspirillum pedocola TaxID=2801341 RepID=A0A934SPP7_9BURK|nr:acyltransferase [Noviherbaspirillum pedocola]MBK4734325.1 acyltransferase [Noviherbaspirillum pedocola]
MSSLSYLQNQFELHRGDTSSNMRSMEGLRGFAVILVFVVHYVTLVTPWLRGNTALASVAHALHTVGNSGVDLFFVLSGYLIYGSLISREQKFVPFIKRRIRRIYPVFTFLLITYIVLSLLFPTESKLPGGLFDAFVYLAANFLLLPGLLPITPIITVAWSLSYEMFYYISLPALISIFKLRGMPCGWRIGFFVTLTVVFALACAQYGGPTRLLMFVSGILLYDVIEHRLFSSVGSALAFSSLMLGLLCTLVPIPGPFGATLKAAILFATFFVVCHTCFARSSSVFARAFSVAGLRWLGNMSYSYYLVHGLALKAAFLILMTFFPPREQGIVFFAGLMIAMFLWTLVASALMFIAIERPLSLDSARRPKVVNPRLTKALVDIEVVDGIQTKDSAPA